MVTPVLPLKLAQVYVMEAGPVSSSINVGTLTVL
jgi:hypothetical protein